MSSSEKKTPMTEVLAQHMAGPKLLLPQPKAGFGMKVRKHGHELVVKTAVDMAHEVFEECSSNNEWHKLNPNRESYVQKSLPFFLPKARAILSDLMVQTKDAALQEKIYEALCLDAQFIDRVVT